MEKIVINKIGPKYPALKDTIKGDNEVGNFLKKLHRNTFIQESKVKYYNIEEAQFNNNFMNYIDKFSPKLSKGYSLIGFRGNKSLNLRKETRKINFEKIKKITGAFGNEIKIKERHRKLRKSYDKNNSQSLKIILLKQRMQNEKLLKERHCNVKLINEITLKKLENKQKIMKNYELKRGKLKSNAYKEFFNNIK